jgi:hypothetical protein
MAPLSSDLSGNRTHSAASSDRLTEVGFLLERLSEGTVVVVKAVEAADAAGEDLRA